jgi:hypothetical protein
MGETEADKALLDAARSGDVAAARAALDAGANIHCKNEEPGSIVRAKAPRPRARCALRVP